MFGRLDFLWGSFWLSLGSPGDPFYPFGAPWASLGRPGLPGPPPWVSR